MSGVRLGVATMLVVLGVGSLLFGPWLTGVGCLLAASALFLSEYHHRKADMNNR